jgi:hypothetical protein
MSGTTETKKNVSNGNQDVTVTASSFAELPVLFFGDGP